MDCEIFIAEITRVIEYMQLVLGCRASAHGTHFFLLLIQCFV